MPYLDKTTPLALCPALPVGFIDRIVKSMYLICLNDIRFISSNLIKDN
ncbi:MAG: hypothetical protein OJF59_000488 [Cytophagales bacterium]|nr:MAG: hypothetical protein OJF59_000488 [Cytophagales bacterium]